MSEEIDPLYDKLRHATNELNRKVRNGEALDGDDLINVRDDLTFVYSHFNIKVNQLEREKVQRNPNATRAFWILLPTGVAGLLGWIGYLIGASGGG